MLASGSHLSNENYTKIESENKQLREALAEYKVALSSAEKSLKESKSHGIQLHERLEEATTTLFRLRPQRQEHTEGEIQGEFHTLSESIKNWIERNCAGFLEDDEYGFETTLNRCRGTPGMETIVESFQLRPNDLTDLKEHVLAAILMRYLFDKILSHPWPIVLGREIESFLKDIYKSMERVDSPKGNTFYHSPFSYSNANNLLAFRPFYNVHLEKRYSNGYRRSSQICS